MDKFYAELMKLNNQAENSIENINEGGCGIYGLFLAHYIHKRKPDINTKFRFLVEVPHTKILNKYIETNDMTSMVYDVGPAWKHIVVEIDENTFIDSEGIYTKDELLTKYENLYRSKLDLSIPAQYETIDLLTQIDTWNHIFQRIKAIPKLQKIFQVDFEVCVAPYI